MMTDADIVEIRDSMLPSQGEALDLVKFARSIEAAATVGSFDVMSNAWQAFPPDIRERILQRGTSVYPVSEGIQLLSSLVGVPWHIASYAESISKQLNMTFPREEIALDLVEALAKFVLEQSAGGTTK